MNKLFQKMEVNLKNNSKKYEIIEKKELNENILIFKILNIGDNKTYIIKKIALKEESQEDLEKIKNHIKKISSINSKLVIKYVNIFIKKNTFNIVTEHYEGMNLSQLVNNYKNENKLISQNLIYHIIKEICLGLKELHNNNIIHGDLNLNNIYLNKDYEIKIGGFNIFKLLNNYNDYLISQNELCNYNNNNYSYNAPEIIKNEEINCKNDIWSLGCIIYELCALQHCFECKNIVGLHNKIINEFHKKIDLKIYEHELQNLIDLLLKKNHRERPNINEVCNIVIRNCGDKDKKYMKKEGKNKIKMIIEIKDEDLNKDIYFLNNTNYEDENRNKNNHDSLQEFNESNVKLYINHKKYRYQKFFRFATKGEYKIKIKFYMLLKDCSNMFYNCNTIKSIDLSKFDSKNVTNMSNMFFNCENLSEINFTNINTEKVTNMSNLFCKCYNMKNIDLSSFNTSNVTDMSGMFQNCDKLTNIDLSKFNTQNVIDMSNMFSYCNNLTNLDLSLFDTKKVKNMSGMFYMCENLSNLDLSNFNTENVINMSEMFCHCEKLININLCLFNVKNVITMEKMFYNCNNIKNLDLSSFQIENVSNISRMFYECKNLESINLSFFNIKNNCNCFQMFCDCKNLKKIIVNRNEDKNIDINFLEKEFKENNINPEIIYNNN